jgi:hypothetical protein
MIIFFILFSQLISKGLIVNYLKFFNNDNNKVFIEKLINRNIKYDNSKSYYNSIVYSNEQPLKSLNFIVDPYPQRRKYIIIKEFPILCMYIPWKYGLQLDPAEIKRIEYFTQVALNRGYNKFILQMIFVDDVNKYAIASKNLDHLTNYIGLEIQKFLKISLTKRFILFKNEIIMKSELSEITYNYGGFFLIATTVDDDKYKL